jgi:hypothetical protein
MTQAPPGRTSWTPSRARPPKPPHQSLHSEAGRAAASEEAQDEGSVAAQLLEGVETAVGVWQKEGWRGVIQRVRCHVCIAQPAHEVVV